MLDQLNVADLLKQNCRRHAINTVKTSNGAAKTRKLTNNSESGTSISTADIPEACTSKSSGLWAASRLAYFKHDAGHVNMAFVDLDGWSRRFWTAATSV